MPLTQDRRRPCGGRDIRSHLTPAGESAFMSASDLGSVANPLVSGYHMASEAAPDWMFGFGGDGRHVVVHDSVLAAAIGNDHGMAVESETSAVARTAFERLIRLGRDRLGAAAAVRKGPS